MRRHCEESQTCACFILVKFLICIYGCVCCSVARTRVKFEDCNSALSRSHSVRSHFISPHTPVSSMSSQSDLRRCDFSLPRGFPVRPSVSVSHDTHATPHDIRAERPRASLPRLPPLPRISRPVGPLRPATDSLPGRPATAPAPTFVEHQSNTAQTLHRRARRANHETAHVDVPSAALDVLLRCRCRQRQRRR